MIKHHTIIERWWPVEVIGLAFLLRIINLNLRPLWYDEAFAVLYAEKSLGAILRGTLTPVQGAAADVHPVAFYFLLHGWMTLVGQTPLAVRMLSVLYGVGTVALVYRLMRNLFSEQVGLWSAFVVAVAPFQIAYSQEARMYAMLGFWSAAALAAYVRAWRTDSLREWAAFVVCGALALYSHNLAFALFAAIGLWAVLQFLIAVGESPRSVVCGLRSAIRLLLKTVLSGLAMLILFTPWLLRVPGQLGKIGQAYWVTRPTLTSLVQTLIAFHFDFENAVFPHWLLPLALFGSVLALALIIWQVVVHEGHERTLESLGGASCPSWKTWLLLTLTFLPVGLVFVLSQWIPIYIIRGLLPASIVYGALAGWALSAMPCRARVVFGLSLLALVAVVLIAFYGYTGFPRGPYSTLDAFLRVQSQPGDAIIHSNKLTFFPAHVYDRMLPQVFIGDPPGSGSDTLARPTQEALGLFPTDLESATAGKSRIWLVIFQQAIAEVKGTHPHIAWLEARFTQKQVLSFGDMDVMVFEREAR